LVSEKAIRTQQTQQLPSFNTIRNQQTQQLPSFNAINDPTMPITFYPTDNKAEKVVHKDQEERDNREEKQQPTERVAGNAPKQKWSRRGNGFVDAVCMAYNEHHHLILRPDDVWLAIMVQFAAYVEKNSTELRSKLVSFDDVKELVVVGDGTFRNAPYDWFCTEMAKQIAAHIKDPSIHSWVIPNFTTTTPEDQVVGSIALMASLQEFFRYTFFLKCGLPQVTLQGTAQDWQDVADRAKRLQEFDTKEGLMAKWCALLHPVLQQFVESAQGKPSLEWWNRVCSHIDTGSGPTYLSGWITVFCVFDKTKQWQGDLRLTDRPAYDVREGVPFALLPMVQKGNKRKREEFTEWPIIDTNKLPSGSCQVPVKVVDAPAGKTYQCRLTAGHFGFVNVDDVSVQPSVQWCLDEFRVDELK